jgi:single-strand DNA-binding protein
MMHDAPVYLAGHLATEPQFKKVAGDVSWAKLRIAYTARWRNRETGEWSEGPTTFVNVQCWRNLADNVRTCLRKGEPVLVFGRLRIRRYNDAEGNPRTVTEVEASSVGHDLTRGTAHFSRSFRSPGRSAAEAAGDQADGQDADTAAPGALNGDGVVDEAAVAEFARELSALGPDAVAGPEAAVAGPEAAGDAREPGDTEDPEDAEAEPAGSPRS